MEFLNSKRLEAELKDIRQDLDGFPLTTSDCRIGDFGCGSGYPTLSLMLHLHAIDCRGLDKYNFWELPTIEEARQQFNNGQDAPAGSLTEKIKQLLDEGRWPTFQLGDVLDAERLPNNLDLAHCKLLLGNIQTGEFQNSLNGDEGVKLAINSIVACMKQDGLFYIVEKPAIDFRPFLLAANLKFLRFCQVSRPDIGSQGRRSYAESFCVYLYRKL